jgi:hypothetical protein
MFTVSASAEAIAVMSPCRTSARCKENSRSQNMDSGRMARNRMEDVRSIRMEIHVLAPFPLDRKRFEYTKTSGPANIGSWPSSESFRRTWSSRVFWAAQS